jgi:hypothetical protein
VQAFYSLGLKGICAQGFYQKNRLDGLADERIVPALFTS